MKTTRITSDKGKIIIARTHQIPCTGRKISAFRVDEKTQRSVKYTLQNIVKTIYVGDNVFCVEDEEQQGLFFVVVKQ
jgi:hypothetical protein